MTNHTEIPRYKPLGPTHTPFGHIALAFSGGGFRAAAYSLGVLSYFHHLRFTENAKERPLLEHVAYLSSASGGTITTAFYALCSAKGESFAAFYKKLYEALRGTELLETALKKLNDHSMWRTGAHTKRRNLINAFALAYDEMLYKNARLEDLGPSGHSHLEEVCFNTTEFYKGILFRQTAKMKTDHKADPDFLFGNFLVHLDRAAAKHLKLADLLAASSCFPAGFEPIMFPDDFTYRQGHHSLSAANLRRHLHVEAQELSWPELKLLYGEAAVRSIIKELEQRKPGFSAADLLQALRPLPLQQDFEIGMMDGGITDNQGLESMMRANDRRERGQTQFAPFDLMLVNDVGSHFIDPYVLPGSDKGHNKAKGIGIISILAISGMAALLGLCGFTGSMFLKGSDWYKVITAVSTVLLLASSLVIGAILSVRRLIRGKLGKSSGLNLARNFSSGISRLFFRYFGGSVFIVLYSMVQERINSVVLLNTNVFLKRIREVLYQKFFDSEQHLFRIKTNHIFDTSFSNDGNKERHEQPAAGAPGTAMKCVAEAAFRMGTTLWFDKARQTDHSQAAIVACGQFSTCYNLLLYTETYLAGETYKSLKADDPCKLRVDELHQKLQADYQRFNEDPFFLFNQLGKTSSIEGFEPASSSWFPYPEEFEGLRSQRAG